MREQGISRSSNYDTIKENKKESKENKKESKEKKKENSDLKIEMGGNVAELHLHTISKRLMLSITINLLHTHYTLWLKIEHKNQKN